MKIQQSYFSRVDNPLEEKEKSFGEVCLLMHGQGLQILLTSGVSESSDSHILESFWNIWSQVSQRKEPCIHYREGYTK